MMIANESLDQLTVDEKEVIYYIWSRSLKEFIWTKLIIIGLIIPAGTEIPYV